MNDKNYLLDNIEDKIILAKQKNRILNTAFLTSEEIPIVERLLKSKKETSFLFSGGFENAERKCLFVYPDRFDEKIVHQSINNTLKAIHIKLPKEMYRDYRAQKLPKCTYEITDWKGKDLEILLFLMRRYL